MLAHGIGHHLGCPRNTFSGTACSLLQNTLDEQTRKISRLVNASGGDECFIRQLRYVPVDVVAGGGGVVACRLTPYPSAALSSGRAVEYHLRGNAVVSVGLDHFADESSKKHEWCWMRCCLLVMGRSRVFYTDVQPENVP